MTRRSNPDLPRRRDPADPTSVLTVPNALTAVRIFGSFALVWLAAAEHVESFIGLFVVLVLTDWLDGRLAILLDQRTVLGARLEPGGTVTWIGWGVLLAVVGMFAAAQRWRR